eukprot:CAMPEP_0179060094 /NCGR_PEP_ID=MMETSP0796-20121207/25688_1 /TAXON_ID=73915 /ORGANISM="Pyrodinium bahamense, Strain pbaha01" /LENGTH=236 /DNA_ID=CAMNT_0020756865 /DNA_START=211 /DNA_END=921 /DNA_ORIENTATION=+
MRPRRRVPATRRVVLAALAAALACAPAGWLAFAATSSPHPTELLARAGLPGERRPSQAEVLAALGKVKPPPLAERGRVFEAVTAPGKRWRLTYVASKDQMAAARSGADSLPGVYVPDFIDYLLTFEGQGAVLMKREGISGDGFFVGDIARCKWPEAAKRTTMVIESMVTIVKAFGQELSFPAEGVVPGPEGDQKFEGAPAAKSGGGSFTTVNYVYADSNVAVAIAQTGAIALYVTQ